ncbi:MAG: proton-conducting transporter membrane subunit [Sulfurospirillaceae bacterium]|nr:proton-conducting transporter membrane subunit [Sulfurospirillaceae bacterium]
MTVAFLCTVCVATVLGVIFITKENKTRAYAIFALALGHLLLTLCLLNLNIVHIDALSKFILIIISTLYLGITFHGISYFSICQSQNNNKYVALSLVIFLVFATLMIVADELISMWIFLETASLACAPLIYYNKNKASIEATWKYLFLCSIGIILALVGMLFISYSAIMAGASDTSLSFENILANGKSFNSTWLKISFVFIFIGFATKTGLFPLHSWKADAYGEEPGIFGALMAGGMTSLSWLALIRLMQIMNASKESALMQNVLVFFGVASMLFASIGMLNQSDIKRVLAYSSIEHMGIISLGFGVGGVGIFGALFHIFNNALLKGAIFIAVGNIKRAFGEKTLYFVSGAIGKIPISGTILFITFLAIVGTPPFGSFFSIFSILKGTLNYSNGLLFFMIMGLIFAFIGISKTILSATRGKPKDIQTGYKDTLGMYLVPLVLLLITLFVGINMPNIMQNLLNEASLLIKG